ncbi:hypothetical protein VTI74DRAFT_11157 [Chaetomium olivicolor]
MAPRTCLPALVLVVGLFAAYIAGQTTTTGTAIASSTSAADNAEGLEVCWGKDSICEAQNDLRKQCSQQEEAHGSNGYYGCVCTSGYGAVQEACDNCRLVYGLMSSRLANYTITCSSMSLTLAPIPSSILAQQSSRNATLYAANATRTAEPLTNAVTLNGWPTEPLPTVATTFSLPLATGAAARQLPPYWPLGGVVVVRMLVGI